ncbi:MAG: hypothetical protein ABSB32_18500 [Thermodesulfobacteriota bacterium]
MTIRPVEITFTIGALLRGARLGDYRDQHIILGQPTDNIAIGGLRGYTTNRCRVPPPLLSECREMEIRWFLHDYPVAGAGPRVTTFRPLRDNTILVGCVWAIL